MVKLICYIKKYLKVTKILTSGTEKIKNIFYLVLCHNIWQWVSSLSGLSHSLSTGHLEKYQLSLWGLAPLMLQDNHYTFMYLIFTIWQHENIFHPQAKHRQFCARAFCFRTISFALTLYYFETIGICCYSCSSCFQMQNSILSWINLFKLPFWRWDSETSP